MTARAALIAALANAVLFLALLLLEAARAAPLDATFVHISDIHFNPFELPPHGRDLAGLPLAAWPAHFAAGSDHRLSRWGEDTNHALLETALADISRAAAGADFVLLTGDLLAHDFPARTERAFGFRPGSAESRAFAVKTTLFVAARLRAALPGKPIVLSLGNTDSGCGDYRIDAGGPYLQATRETVRDLAGSSLLAADFDESYLAGGFYAASHPTQADTTLLVLDDALWSPAYRNACGTTGLGAAHVMLAWLERQLATAEAAGRRVWLLHHIPAGIDAYGTVSAKGTTCRERIVPMLAEPFASRFTGLLARYAGTVTASFSGHDHHDDYRLLRDRAGAVIGTEKIAPAISPVFGQNPGFLLFSYDRASGAVADFAARYLANLDTAANAAAAEWEQEYRFSAAYSAAAFTPSAVEAMWKQLQPSGAADTPFRRLYNVSHGELGKDDLPAYACAIGYTDPAAFADCYCGR
ncbi:3',5'-cyclic AMP phosphodiesterase CpdA [Ancylobacter sp. 3268]|uniref:metallophosphoesterase n=1 Tax=Ancylobacter sp. 3268 TaxID=2817752 RepID=UPI0028610A19|nr:metallophosphoesterase [Ancylobacter sp. 3268]MDR6952542.1 3',5'-cyclic AMP phosphodiesterase CpdA [Ancylobacter sp. 3268]